VGFSLAIPASTGVSFRTCWDLGGITISREEVDEVLDKLDRGLAAMAA
jgi:hypothetical protein